MPITLSQTNNEFNINNTTPIQFLENDASGVSTSTLDVSSNGITNYVPYSVSGLSGANPTSLAQIGGVSIFSGTSTISSTNIATPMNNVNTGTLSIGTYYIVGSVDVIPSSTATTVSWGVFFDTSSGLLSAAILSAPYFVSRNYVLNITNTFTATKIQTHTSLIANLTSSIPIYLNFYANMSTGFTARSTIVVARLG